jgi:hypothetical protein
MRVRSCGGTQIHTRGSRIRGAGAAVRHWNLTGHRNRWISSYTIAVGHGDVLSGGDGARGHCARTGAGNQAIRGQIMQG